jgi:REP element-mobilizing transposase RayT
MGQDLRIEDADHTSFITTRTLGSRLWFHKQKHLQERIRAYLGKYQEKYSVIIYAFTILGNHYHLQAKFPHCNRAEFMRDFNSMITRLTKRYVSSCPEGSLWACRYKTQAIVREEDSEEYFLYVALNPISSGLVKKLGDYNNFGYSSCFHSLREAQQSYKIIDWRTFQDKRRFNKKLSPKDFESTYTLTFSRLAYTP